MISNTAQWQNALEAVARADKKLVFTRFFKTGKGEYGEGDEFIGVTVVDNRKVAREAISLPFDCYSEMLRSPIHEHRLSALLALVLRYKRTKSTAEKEEIARFYLSNLPAINNWDLVDLSCEYIIGEEALRTGDCSTLHRLAKSADLWEKRIAIVSNLQLVRAGKFDAAIEIIGAQLCHPHDLIQKANGWVLREIGKKDGSLLRQFIDQNYDAMPRTTLRYAIERFPDHERKSYLNRNKNKKKPKVC